MTAPVADRRALESLIATTLHYGTWLSMAVITVGLGLTALGDPGLALPTGINIVTAGLALLILLPVVRVTLMLIVFARDRDYLIAAIAGLVLLIILIGLALGTHGDRRAATLTTPSISSPCVPGARYTRRLGTAHRW